MAIEDAIKLETVDLLRAIANVCDETGVRRGKTDLPFRTFIAEARSSLATISKQLDRIEVVYNQRKD